MVSLVLGVEWYVLALLVVIVLVPVSLGVLVWIRRRRRLREDVEALRERVAALESTLDD
jgi:sensor domain CHASE-containing protein